MVADRILIGAGDVVSYTTADHRSQCAAEMFGCLESLQRTSNIFVTNNDATKIEPAIASKCLVVIRKLEKETKIVSMNTKLHPIVRELIFIKLKRSSSLKFIKVDAHQDDTKSFE